MKKYFLLFAIAILVKLNCTYGQSVINNSTRLKEYFQFLNNVGFSGQILVAEKSKPVIAVNFGYSNKETMYPISSTTAFNIGSLAKQFTAIAILWLEQNGRLSTSDTLGKFWDTLANDKKSISIHQLLTHTSGFSRQAVQTSEVISKNKLLEEIFSSNLRNKPGASFQYSNSGYEVLAAIVEKITGTTFKDFIRQTFILPNNLTHTYFNSGDLSGINHKIAIGYNEWEKVENPLTPSKNWNNTGASNIFTTADDLYKWFRLVLSNKILNPAETEKLFTSFTKTDEDEEYGYGWFITKTSSGKKWIYHGGDLAGFHSEFSYYPEDERIIYIITNQELFGFGISKYRIESVISKILSGTKVEFPLETIHLKPDNLYKYCGTYEMDSANSFKIWINGGQLTIGAWGQSSIDLLIPTQVKLKLNLNTVSEKSLQLLKAVITGQDTIAKQIISPKAFDIYFPPLKEKYNAYAAAMDGNVSVSLGGTIPAYWRGDDVSRTYIKLNFASGSSNFYLGWTSKGLYDVTVNDERPFPLIYPLVFLNKMKCSVYDLDNAKEIAIEFDTDTDGIVKRIILKGEDGSKVNFKKIN